MQHSGSCLCGAVSYKTTTDFTDIVHCHCSMCRKLSGSAFLAYGSVEHSAVEVSGMGQIKEHQASSKAVRSFCRECGSTLFWLDGGDYGKQYLCIALGTLDTEFKPQKWQHYYTENKAPWFEILDEQTTYSETPE